MFHCPLLPELFSKQDGSPLQHLRSHGFLQSETLLVETETAVGARLNSSNNSKRGGASSPLPPLSSSPPRSTQTPHTTQGRTNPSLSSLPLPNLLPTQSSFAYSQNMTQPAWLPSRFLFWSISPRSHRARHPVTGKTDCGTHCA